MKKVSCPIKFDIWMKMGRPWKDQSLDATFMDNWWTWWNTLKVLPENKIVGPSRVMLFIVGLAWWRAHVKEEGHVREGDKSWAMAVSSYTAP